MFKVDELASLSSRIFCNTGLQELNNSLKGWGKGLVPFGSNNHKWIENGKEFEILVPGDKGWQKGRLRIKVVLEFCPDEAEIEEILEENHIQTNHKEQSLDDIRQQINQVN